MRTSILKAFTFLLFISISGCGSLEENKTLSTGLYFAKSEFEGLGEMILNVYQENGEFSFQEFPDFMNMEPLKSVKVTKVNDTLVLNLYREFKFIKDGSDRFILTNTDKYTGKRTDLVFKRKDVNVVKTLFVKNPTDLMTFRDVYSEKGERLDTDEELLQIGGLGGWYLVQRVKTGKVGWVDENFVDVKKSNNDKPNTTSSLTSQYKTIYNSDKVHLIDTTKVNKRNFSLMYKTGSHYYLFGKYPLNEVVTILDNETGALYETKTVDYFLSEDEMNGKTVLTKIEKQPTCSKYGQLIAMFIKMPNDYIKFKMNKINDMNFVMKIDGMIRSSGYLDVLLNKDKGIGYQSDEILKGVIPELQKIKTKTIEYTVVTYKVFSSRVFGPRLVVINNKIIPLTGQCSSDYFYPFFMNGKNYIQTGSGCCECGIVGEHIFYVSEKDIVSIYDDYGFSN